MACGNMIKKIISELARSIGLEVFGFSKNSFTALFPYYVSGESGNISMYARGEDYHKVVKAILLPIKEKFEEYGATDVIIHCDNGEYDDRRAAYEAGLGFFGRNNMLINDKYGSYFFIGQVIHNLELEPDKPLEKSCLSCGKCIESCITGTLKSGFEESMCLSAITQKKGELSETEKKFIIQGGLCWGCDVCQKVCPHNRGVVDTFIEGFKNNRILSLDLIDLEELSERKFRDKYSAYAFSWRGGRVLKRNLEILRECRENDEEK